jgi:ATP-dependent Zn protease
VAARKSAKTTTLKRTTVDARTRTAFHEAGHAVMSAAIANPPVHVTIKPDAQTLGRSGARMSARSSSRIQVHLAGYAAEHVLPRASSAPVRSGCRVRGGRARRPRVAGRIRGAADRDGHRAVQTVLAMGAAETDDEIRREVDRLYEIARESLSAVWPAVEAVAKALLKHEELDRDGLDEAIAAADIYVPVVAVQRAHGLLP